MPSVLVNLGEFRATVTQFYAERRLDLPVVCDTTAETQKLWDIASVPTIVLIDGQNRMAMRGRAMWKDLAAAVCAALGLPAGIVRFTVQGTEHS